MFFYLIFSVDVPGEANLGVLVGVKDPLVFSEPVPLAWQLLVTQSPEQIAVAQQIITILSCSDHQRLRRGQTFHPFSQCSRLKEFNLMVEVLDGLITVYFEMHNLKAHLNVFKFSLQIYVGATLLLGSTFKLFSLICRRLAAFWTLRRSSLPRLNDTPDEITASRFFSTVPLNGRDKLKFEMN